MAGVNVNIGGTNRDLKDVLRDSTGAIVLSQKQWEAAFQESGKHADSLFGSLKRMSREARSHERVFGFYGAQLAAAAGSGKELASSLVGVGIALGSGMWVVAAVEGVKALVEHFREAGREAKEAAEKAEKEWKASLKGIEDGVTSLKNKLLELQGIDPLQHGYQQKLLEVSRQINAIRREQGLEGVKNEDDPRLVALKKQYTELVEKIREYQKAKAEVAGKEAQNQASKDAQSEKEARDKAAQEHNTFMLQKQAELASGEEKIRLEGERAEEEAWNRSRADMQGAYDAEIKAIRDVTEEKVRQFKIQEDLKNNKDYWAALARDAAAGTEGEGQDLSKNPAQVAAQATRDADKALKDLAKHQEQVWKEVGASISSALGSLGSAIGGMAGSMMSTLGKLIQQAIQLAVAMSATAGPLGWLNAAAAAAAIIATIASVPEFRASGGPVSTGMPYVVGERGPELFVPGSDGSIVPNGAFGGGSTSVTIQAMDARSFSRFLKDNPTALVEALAELKRNGRNV